MSRDRKLPDTHSDHPLEEMDAAVADVLLPFAGKSAVKAIGAVSDLSDQEPLYAGTGAMLATAALMRNGPAWRAGTRVLASHLFATALRGVVKAGVDRTRPDAAAEKGEYVLREGHSKDSDFNSFPSGHTAGAVAVAMAVGRAYPAARLPALGLAALAGAAQVVRSKHYVTDVVAGALLGLGCEAAVHGLLRKAEAF
jgi:membrane-associated phospholipid phosphatase